MTQPVANSTTSANTILSQDAESFQTVDIGDTRIVISGTLAPLSIGEGTDFGDDYTQTKNLCVFAENLIFSKTFRMQNGIISAHSLDASSFGSLFVVGQNGADANQSGSIGTDGKPGGNLTLYLESVATLNLNILAYGGTGGNARKLLRMSQAEYSQLLPLLTAAKTCVSKDEFYKDLRQNNYAGSIEHPINYANTAVRCYGRALSYLYLGQAIRLTPEGAVEFKVFTENLKNCIKTLNDSITPTRELTKNTARSFQPSLPIVNKFFSTVSCLDNLEAQLSALKKQFDPVEPICGKGGDGGNVLLIAGLPYKSWTQRLQDVDAQPLAARTSKLLEWLDSINKVSVPGNPDLQISVKSWQAAAATPTTEVDWALFLGKIGNKLWSYWSDYADGFSRTVSIGGMRGGIYGATYGQGLDPSKNGQRGKPGTCQTLMLEFASFIPPTGLPPIHPSQCSKVLNSVKLMYWSLDPATLKTGEKSQDIKDIVTLLLRLQARTQPFVDAKIAKDDASELVKFYKANEAKIGSLNSVAQLRAINEEARLYLDRIRQGADFFGYEYHYVPLESFQFYQDLLNDLTANFQALETSCNGYLKSLENRELALQHLREARAKNSFILAQESQSIAALESRLPDIEGAISSFEAILPTLRATLNIKIQDLKDNIKKHFDFDITLVLEALSVIAFAPESGLMLVTQAASLLNEATTKITNNQGLHVNKNYIVQKIQSIQADIKDVKGLANYKFDRISALPLEDPAADKFVASGQQILSMLDEFYSQFPVEMDDLKNAFRAYVSQIQQRNGQILSYNAIVSLILQKKQTVAASEAQTQAFNDEALNTVSQANLPDLVTFASRIYYAARNQIMEVLDLTARAYRFWAVSDYNIVTNAYQNNPVTKFDSEILNQASRNILNPYGALMRDRYGTNSTPFNGMIYDVPQAMLKASSFNTSGLIYVNINLLDIIKLRKSFNVRVTSVRVWIAGITTSDNTLLVEITHSGNEKILDQHGRAFEFHHDEIKKQFFLRDINNRIIGEEANFGIENALNETTKNKYAAVGPFTMWQILVDLEVNPGLDLSKVTGIQLEFAGTNYALK